MNELRRLAYLDALGVDCYVSRSQLAGAAATRRLALVRASVAAAPAISPIDSPAPRNASPGPAQLREQMSTPPVPSKQSTDQDSARAAAAQPNPPGVAVPQLHFAVLFAGQWLWIESLGDTPLMREQVWLVESMANALRVASGTAESGATPLKATVMQFDWPIHNNPQLDSGEQGARASLAGFLERQRAQHGAKGLVLLGEACGEWVDETGLPTVVTPGTRALLESPALKKQAWASLARLAQP